MYQITNVPDSVQEWIESLPNHKDMNGWEPVAFSVYDGIQNTIGDNPDTQVMVWGNVITPFEEIDIPEDKEAVQWCVYEGTNKDVFFECDDPLKAMDYAVRLYKSSYLTLTP